MKTGSAHTDAKFAKQKSGMKAKTPSFPIVGVGASAGGLEAYTELLKMLPVDTGMAFVLVQHLDPLHESGLTRLLAGATAMPTMEVTDGLRVERNHVYVIPPNKSLFIVKGVLKLEPRPPERVPHRSIDLFFESLAQDQKEMAIGVILSGTANDGTLGLEVIKAEGGITFAQDESAKQDSMPRSAVMAGCVDYVLSPEKIADALTQIAKHPLFTGATIAETKGDGEKQGHVQTEGAELLTEGSGFKKILVSLRNHCGVDFSLYKISTIQRRVARRMLLCQKDTLDEYAAFLKGNATEVEALYSDVLINVTSFFRNPEAFDALKEKVFPRLLQQRQGNDPLRVWVLGCSTGQEAYSFAMSFAEYFENMQRVPKLQIFATDLNDALLDRARSGLYAKTLAAELSAERLERFFVEEEGGYRVIKSLCDKIVFARQNLISDPPFSRTDLISCRNLMIYLETDLQAKIIPIFHYALKPGGFLFLGASESIGQFTNLFEAVDKKQKIFSKKTAPAQVLQLPGSTERPAYHQAGQHSPSPIGKEPEEGLRAELNAQREADRISLNKFAPPGVLINAELQVLQFRGTTSEYLEPPTGKATFDVLKMARKGLLLPLRAAITKAKKEEQTVSTENVQVQQTGGGIQTVTIHVIPMNNLKERCFLILFEPASAQSGRRVPVGRPRKPLSKKEESRRIAVLESELAESRDYTQAMQQQFEAATEELQASNEEVQSANEELQSINEELETSKEELESTNEELTTVNEEMSNRNVEVNRLNADLSNLQTNLHTAILVLGRDLRIRRFTAPAEKIFNLLAGDIGRSLGGIKHNLVDLDTSNGQKRGAAESLGQPYPLEALVREVIDTISTHTREVQDNEGRWYSLTVRPYLTLDNKVDGAVLVLVDIDALKRSEEQAKAARDYNEAIIRTVRDPLLILHADLRVDTANEAFYKTFNVRPEETEGRFIFDIGQGQWNMPKLRSLLEDILPRNSFFNDIELIQDFPVIGRRTMLLNSRQLKQDNGARPLILLSIEDVTERLESRAALKASEIRYRRIFEAAQDGILILNPMTRKITDSNPFMTKLVGYARQELIGRELWEIGLLKDEQVSHATFRELQRSGFIRYDDLPLQGNTGEPHEVEFVSNLYQEEDGTKVIQCNIRDISERKRELKLFRSLFDLMPPLGWTALPDGFIDWYNKSWYDYTGSTIEEMKGWGWQSIHDPKLLPAIVERWKKSLSTGEPFEIEFPLRRHDGVFRWFLTRATLMKDAEGKPLRWVGISTDIQDQKDQTATLERLVRERTNELSVARDQAVNANEAKSRFLATVSHEVRTPLAGVIGIVELLAATSENEETASLAKTALESSTRLLQILNDVLDASRLQAGKVTLEHRSFYLRPVIGDVVQLVKLEASKKGLQIKSFLDPGVPELVCGDELRIRQILLNLVFNAVKFTSTGQISVGCSVIEHLSNRVIIRFAVEDTGIGITEAQKDKIFEPFVQAEDSTTRVFGGTGLGLSICKNLVSMMDGQIGVDSQPGKGSTFWVQIPFINDLCPLK